MPSMNPQKFFDVATVLVVFLLSASILFAQGSAAPVDGETAIPALESSQDANLSNASGSQANGSESLADPDSQAQQPVEANLLVTATSVIEHEIVASDRKEFGRVSDIVISSDGKMAFLIVQSGDILGLGGKEFAIPLAAVAVVTNQHDEATKNLRVDKSSESMSQANTLNAVDRLELADEQWVKRNNQFFGVDMPFSDKAQISVKAILEKQVSSIDGEDAGNLHDLLLRFDEKKFEFAIVEHGGLLGVGETFVALPFDNLIFSQDRDLKWLISTKLDTRAIQSRQQVTPNEYPELKLQSVRNQIQASPTGPKVDLPSKQEQRTEPTTDVSSS